MTNQIIEKYLYCKMVEYDYAVYGENPNDYTFHNNYLIYPPKKNFDIGKDWSIADDLQLNTQYNSKSRVTLSSFKKMAYKFYDNEFPKLFHGLCFSIVFMDLKFWLLKFIKPNDFTEEQKQEMLRLQHYHSLDEIKKILNFFNVKTIRLNITNDSPLYLIKFDVIKFFYEREFITVKQLRIWFWQHYMEYNFNHKMIDYLYETFQKEFITWCVRIIKLKPSLYFCVPSLVYTMKRTDHDYDDLIIKTLYELKEHKHIYEINKHVKVNPKFLIL